MNRLALAFVAIALGVGGCTPYSGGSFVCAGDSECTQGSGGRCEPNGACSFADVECASGQRYGESAGSLAGECTDVPDAAPIDAVPPPPDANPVDLCNAIYENVPSYELCEATSTTCEFFVSTAGTTCNDLCGGLGTTCLSSFDQGSPNCVRATADELCMVAHSTQICICDL